jgi:hypothetical protein
VGIDRSFDWVKIVPIKMPVNILFYVLRIIFYSGRFEIELRGSTMANVLPAPSRLHDKTLYLLRNRPRTITLADIARDTRIGMSWLRKYSEGNIPDPGARRLETLYVYLTGKPLDV